MIQAADTKRIQSKDIPFFLPHIWYTYVQNDPVNFVDLWGLKAGDIFKTVEDAAIDFGLTYNDDSIFENREYGASVYQSGTGYTYTVPSTGGPSSVIMSVPPFAKVEAYLHTHAAYDPLYDNENFSKTDKNTAQHKNVTFYVATPMGKLKVYDPITGKTTLIADNMPTSSSVYNKDKNIGFVQNVLNHIVNFITGNSKGKKDEANEKKNN